MTTLGERLDEAQGVAPGFDRLRLVLATLVLLLHSEMVVIGTGRTVWSTIWVAGELIVPWFFMLSGFLVTMSAQGTRTAVFLANRFMRMIPALAACVLVTVFVLGPLTTTLSLEEYFGARETWAYLLVAVGAPKFSLPGVFESLPYAGMVNVSIWTVRWELLCCFLIALLAATGVLRRPALAVSVLGPIAVAPAIALAFAWWLPGLKATDFVAYNQWEFIEPVSFPARFDETGFDWAIATLAGWNFRIVPYFCAGAAAALLRYRMTASSRLAGIFALLLLVALFTLPGTADGPIFFTAALIPSAYCIAWIGFRTFRPLGPIDRNDYSYGVYLYGFPIQQLVHRAGLDGGIGLLNVLVALPVTFAAAALSWHLVERHFRKVRQLLKRSWPAAEPRSDRTAKA